MSLTFTVGDTYAHLFVIYVFFVDDAFLILLRNCNYLKNSLGATPNWRLNMAVKALGLA